MKYKSQITKRLMWIFNIKGWRQYPKPCWFYPRYGWSCNQRELEIALEDLEKEAKAKPDTCPELKTIEQEVSDEIHGKGEK